MLRLTVGRIPDGREIAVITEGGHPQDGTDETCVVCSVAVIDELPNRDAEAWFKRQATDRPWETRQ